MRRGRWLATGHAFFLVEAHQEVRLHVRHQSVRTMTPIYLDYNATTPLDPAVVEAMLLYLHTHFGKPMLN